MTDLSGPAFRVNAFFLQHIERALQIANTGKIKARLQHVLTRQLHLQST